MPRPLELLLTIAATALGIAFFASTPYWSREPMSNPLPAFVAQSLAGPADKPPLRGPSVLANRRPVPDLNLSLPDDLAVVVRRTGINGETGLIRTLASITTFRLRATGDLVSVAAPTGLDPIRPVQVDADAAYSVHGRYAAVTVERGNTIIRWTENGVTYEVSSRTLDAASLTDIANKLH